MREGMVREGASLEGKERVAPEMIWCDPWLNREEDFGGMIIVWSLR